MRKLNHWTAASAARQQKTRKATVVIALAAPYIAKICSIMCNFFRLQPSAATTTNSDARHMQLQIVSKWGCKSRG